MDIEKMLFELKLNSDTVKKFKKSKEGIAYIEYLDSIKVAYELSEEDVQKIITYKADSLERFKSPKFAWKSLEYFVNNCDEIFNFYDLFSQPKGYSKHFFVVNKDIENETEEILEHFKLKYRKFTHLLEDKRELAIYSMFYKFKKGTDLSEHVVRKAFGVIEDSGIKIGYYYFNPLDRGFGTYSLQGLRSFKIEREEGDEFGDYSSTNGKFRKDLSAGFKSSWEADIARLFNYLGYQWQYEKTYVQTDDGAYIPDFIVDANNERFILEVKGKWDNRSVNKCCSALNKPELNSSKYIIVDSDIFKLVCEEYNNIIPNWETIKINNSNITVPIIGLYVGNRMDYIEPLSINDEIIIIQEKDNPFDKFAIKATDKNGNHIGYIKKEWASIISTKMDYGFTYKATLKAKKLKYKCLDIELKLVNTPRNLNELNILLPLYK